MSELKPCPFCNGPNIVVIEREDKEHPDAVYSMAQCGDCLAEGPLSLDYIQAQKKWNTRAESPNLAATRKLVSDLVELALEWKARDCAFKDPGARYMELKQRAIELGLLEGKI